VNNSIHKVQTSAKQAVTLTLTYPGLPSISTDGHGLLFKDTSPVTFS